MNEAISLNEISAKVDALHKLAQELYAQSADFPAVNCNAKRILGATEILKMNLETTDDLP
jgi:hypothetical protein